MPADGAFRDDLSFHLRPTRPADGRSTGSGAVADQGVVVADVMKRIVASSVAIVTVGCAIVFATIVVGDRVCRAAEPRPFLPGFLAARCLACHGDDDPHGGVSLDASAARLPAAAQARLVVRAIEAIDSGAMPPDGESPIDAETRAIAIGELRIRLQEVAPTVAAPPQPLQRLNRFHYNNTVRDLFRLDRDVFPLPERLMTRHDAYLRSPASPPRIPDVVHVACHSLDPPAGLEGVRPCPKDLRAEHGFDNQADELTMSPLLLDAFLRLAHSIVESTDFNPSTVGIWEEFFATPAEGVDGRAEVRRRLDRFLQVAFRGQVDDDCLDRYTAFAVAKLEQGLPFPEAMKKTAAAVLSSPLFLYRTTVTVHGEEPLALASRLSAFLWGSCPDGELLELAQRGAILHPDVLDRTVDRMLADPRIERFLDMFPTQWMQLESVLAATPDPTLARDFHVVTGTPASVQLILEPLLLFDAVFVEERPLVELVAPTSHYQSEFLRHWYRGPGTPAADDAARAANDETLRRQLFSREFHRVPCDDARFGGVVTNAAVASMTSGPKRTQPVARGVWITEVIFNDPPQPPPADVPPLEEAAADPNLTIREQFAAHRESPSCAGCHTKLDPLGFALENYDITGRWRDRYDNGRSIDAGGTLFRMHAFEGAISFKEAIVAEQTRFARAFTAHLLRYALGRELVPADILTVEEIVAGCADRGFPVKALIRGIVRSDSFRDVGRHPGEERR